MLSLAAIVPHGDEILVPEKGAEKLYEAMLNLREKIMEKKIEEYVFITPHNLRIDTHIAVVLTQYLEGFWKYRHIRFRRKIHTDRNLAGEIYEETRKSDLPVVGVNYGALEGPLSKLQLDWGTLIPLYFLPKRKIVLITPARGIKRKELVNFGEVLGELLEEKENNIALIVSADHAHAHSPDGPYGFHEDAKRYDEFVIKNLQNLEELLALEDAFLENAKPDSYWQLLMLLGALRKKKLKLQEKVYQKPTYFGMAVAWYE